MFEINDNYHRLLKRQLKKHLAEKAEDITNLAEFLDAINEAYNTYDTDYAQLDRTLEVSSGELFKTNKELTKVNGELDRFIYSASHDIKAPLCSVEGIIQVIKLSSDPELNIHLDHLEKSVHQLKVVINSLVNFTKNARIEVSLENVSISECIEDAIDSLWNMENLDLIEVKTNVKTALNNDLIIGDKARISSILQNLVQNAIVYHDFEKENPYIEVNAEISENTCLLEVKDNGSGIDKIHIDKIFDMFYRAHDHSKGNGLGLFIVKEIVTKLNGKISVVSEPGEGTSVSITWPLIKRPNYID